MQEAADFAERLAALLARQHVSQSALAGQMGVSRSTVTGWLKYGKLPDAALVASLCRALGCSADWLLGLTTHASGQTPDGGIRWAETPLDAATTAQREQLTVGLRLFRQMLTAAPREREPAGEDHARAVAVALQAVMRSGAVRLLHVARRDDLESALRERFPVLRQAVVAALPHPQLDTLLRTELVAFLAATQVLGGVIRPASVGLGSGYTMLRLCELSVPGVDQFAGTHWLPLVAFRHESGGDYTANTLAKLMSLRHPGSTAHLLPHRDWGDAPVLAAALDETQRLTRSLGTIFLSASGVDRRTPGGSTHPLTEFRSADFAIEAPALRQAYAGLDEPARFGGEILRMLVDDSGRVIARDRDTDRQPGLDILRYAVAMFGTVCLVAGGRYKALPVLTCLRNALVNAVVVDAEIAEWVLARA